MDRQETDVSGSAVVIYKIYPHKQEIYHAQRIFQHKRGRDRAVPHYGQEPAYLVWAEAGRNGRQIVSGIASWYKPEELVGKKIVFVANLAPAKLCGELSEGMILACDAGDNDVRVLFLDGDVPNGSTIR